MAGATDELLNTSVMSKTIQIADNDATDKAFPLVFNCAKCNQVVGDSVSWVCANEELRTVTLSHVTDTVQQGPKLKMSVEGFDIGSAYIPLSCHSCSTELGRIYRTTPKHLDELRELFTIDVDKINSYQVGCSAQQAANVPNTSDLLTIPQSKLVLAQIEKLQKSHTDLLNSLRQLCHRVMLLEGSSPNQNKSSQGDDTDAPSVSEPPADSSFARALQQPQQRPTTSSTGCEWDVMSAGGKRLPNGEAGSDSSAAVKDKMAALAKRSGGNFTSPNALTKRRKFNGDRTAD